MSRIPGPTPEKAELGPPPRWLKCPRKGQLIGNKFLPFKTPLCDLYDGKVSDQYRFYPKMVFSSFQTEKAKIGLWIDLTNTDRFYAREDVEMEGATYMKFNLRGHGEAPSAEQTKSFIQICREFSAAHSHQIIAIHCTHGFNRTGFLIAAYMVEEKDWSVEAAVASFATARPPGIYKQDYLKELFRRYGEEEDTPDAPELPEWSNESAVDLDDNEAAMNGGNHSNRASTSKQAPVFMEGAIPSVKLVQEVSKRVQLQKKIQRMCTWNRKGFPGSQPVSMTIDNIKFLQQRPYKLSWKADGLRYMMLIQGEGEVYMFDRDNNVYLVPNLTFPHPQSPTKHLSNTLLDGEMIIDIHEGQKLPKFLIYDIIQFEEKSLMDRHFEKRLAYIKDFVVEPRNRAAMESRLNKAAEAFSVRLKEFWELKYVDKLFSEDFKKNFGHELDGVIFQPENEGYVPGRCPSVLKWKPPHLNSIDFKLNIVKENKQGMLPTWKGYLYVLNFDPPFGEMKVTKDLKQYDKKIIECAIRNNQWTFMRERTDKSHPNAIATAEGVMYSIRNPIGEEHLIQFIKTKAFGLMPPPKPGDKRTQKGEWRDPSNSLPAPQNSSVKAKDENEEAIVPSKKDNRDGPICPPPPLYKLPPKKRHL